MQLAKIYGIFIKVKARFNFRINLKGGKMANIGHKQKYNEHKVKILCSAMNLFLKKGYALTTAVDVAKDVGVDKNVVFYIFKDKETLLSLLVEHVLNYQYEVAKKNIGKLTSEGLYLYAVETSLQLYMAESSEHIREMYNISYSLKKPTTVIYNTVTEKLSEIFKVYNPTYEIKDFYELELAVSGIMRSYMTVPCDKYFTIDRKVKRFLESVFLIFKIPNDKIVKTYKFLEEIDFKRLCDNTLLNLFNYVESKIKEQYEKTQ